MYLRFMTVYVCIELYSCCHYGVIKNVIIIFLCHRVVSSHITEVSIDCRRGSMECLSLHEDHLSVSVH